MACAIEIEGLVARTPIGGEIGRRGYLRMEIVLAPWWERGSEDRHAEPLRAQMVMDWDLVDAWMRGRETGYLVRITGTLEVNDTGEHIAHCTAIDCA